MFCINVFCMVGFWIIDIGVFDYIFYDYIFFNKLIKFDKLIYISLFDGLFKIVN